MIDAQQAHRLAGSVDEVVALNRDRERLAPGPAGALAERDVGQRGGEGDERRQKPAQAA
jgi:hypothetical protein